MRTSLLFVALAALAAGGCGDGMAKVKGRVVENGRPKTFPPTTVAVQLSPVGADGKPDARTVYSAVVNPDGSFEVVASGGELPPGKYQVAITATGKRRNELKAFDPAVSPTRRDIRSGSNELTVDLAKPNE